MRCAAICLKARAISGKIPATCRLAAGTWMRSPATAARLAAAEVQCREARAAELVAEELRNAQRALGEITGAGTADELLGRIFSAFCIGK